MPSEPKNAADLSTAVVRDEAAQIVEFEVPACAETGEPGCMDCIEGQCAGVGQEPVYLVAHRCTRCGADDVFGDLVHEPPCVSVSVPEERQEKRTPPLSRIGNELRDVRDSYRLQSASKRLVTNVASVLDALAVAVKGCGHGCVTGPRYGGCGTVVEGRRMLCYFCARKRDAAVDFLLDGRTTT